MRKISNAHIFEPIVARDVTRHKLLDEILSFFGGRAQPMMAQLAEAGKLPSTTFASWRRPSRSWTDNKKRKGSVTRNDRRTDGLISGNRRCSRSWRAS